MKWLTIMLAEIRLPELGVPSAVLSVWFAEVGETVFEGDRLVEVLIAGATFDVSAPVTGRLVEKSAWPDQRLVSGQVLGLIEGDGVTE